MSGIKAVIFDVGGVLHASNSALEEDIFGDLGVGLESLERIRRREILPLVSGEIDEQEFWRNVSAAYGTRPVDASENLLGTPFKAAIRSHDAMRKLAERLREGGVQTAILSNTIEPHARALRYVGMYDGFDHVVLSYEVGMRKPDSEIYHYTLKLLDVEPHEAIFIDDDPVNIDAAEAAGVHGIVYTSERDALDTVHSLVPLR